jgi:hypothetical protein
MGFSICSFIVLLTTCSDTVQIAVDLSFLGLLTAGLLVHFTKFASNRNHHPAWGTRSNFVAYSLYILT